MLQNNRNFRSLVKDIEMMSFSAGRTRGDVFVSLLDYIIRGFCLNAPEAEWKYTKEQSAKFYEMFRKCVLICNDELDDASSPGFCDIPGNLHQNVLYSARSKGFLGQYFTPENICLLMAGIVVPEGETVCDPSCGSGRMLLAANALAIKNGHRAYCAAKDICQECVMMTTVNFLLHGIVGEVVLGDGLDPSDGRLCYITNRHLDDPSSPLYGIPHCEIVPFGMTMQGGNIHKTENKRKTYSNEQTESNRVGNKMGYRRKKNKSPEDGVADARH